MLTRLSEPAHDMYSTSCEFREAARRRTHAVTIVRCHCGGRYVQTVDFSACQATAGATNLEWPCSRGPDESVLSIPRGNIAPCLYLGCGGAGPVAAGPRGVLCNDKAVSLLGQVYLTRVGKGLRTQRRDPAATSTCTNYIARRLYSIHNRRHDRPASRVTHILARLRRRTKLRPSTWPTSRFCTSILNTEVPFATMLHVH